MDWADRPADPGTADLGGTDYTALSPGTLTFAPNETSKTIAVLVTGDTVDEPDETVVIELSSAVQRDVRGWRQHGSPAPGTITDDDATPAITLALSPGLDQRERRRQHGDRDAGP